MKYLKWIGVAAALLLVVSCFTPWYLLPWNNNILSGIDGGEKYGRPGYGHFVLTFLFLLFTFIPRIWAKQWNVLIAAVNLAWMIRNFFAIAAWCPGGECAERQTGIWLVLAASVVMLVAALFPDIKVPAKAKPQ